MARITGKTVRSNRRPAANRYSQRTLMHDREYGFYWYAWLWKLVRPLLIVLISLVIVLGIVAQGWQFVYGHFFEPVNPQDTAVREFVIESGDYVTTIGDHLYEQGFIKNTGIFKYIVQFQELTNKLQVGSYPLSPSMDINEILGILAKGSASNERTITIIPGWTVTDIANYLLKQGAIANVGDFEKLCKDHKAFKSYSYSLQDAIDSKTIGERKFALEGYLAPDTYQVYRNATSEQIIQKLLNQFDAVRNNVFNSAPNVEMVYDEDGNRLDENGNIMTEDPEVYETTLTNEQTIVLASIIEKEAGKKADYKKVSAVFHNRLTTGMRLESDATVAYAAGIRRLVLTNDELSNDGPYNTYTRAGLPVGPICNPSAAAIEAALYPDMDYIYDGYLYFCATDPSTGGLHFSKTKSEHEAAVAQYRPLWIEYDQRNSQG